MKLVITDVNHNGRGGIKVEGYATCEEMPQVINALIHSHIEALVCAGVPRQEAAASTAREIVPFILSPGKFADESIIASIVMGGERHE